MGTREITIEAQATTEVDRGANERAERTEELDTSIAIGAETKPSSSVPA